jgi:hypothetical protein
MAGKRASRLAMLLVSAGALLTGCGGDAADDAADRLDNAAAQSGPAAADVLTGAADDLRDDEPANPAAEAQNALQRAGNAQATAPDEAPHAGE